MHREGCVGPPPTELVVVVHLAAGEVARGCLHGLGSFVLCSDEAVIPVGLARPPLFLSPRGLELSDPVPCERCPCGRRV